MNIRFALALILLAPLLSGGACGAGDGGESRDGGSDSSALTLSLPINGDEVMFIGGVKSGIWPYGAQGGDHPFGHPGIDFDCALETVIRAAADGQVAGVYDSYYPDERSITLRHNSTFVTYYTGFFTQELVTAGQNVKRGDPLALADFFLGRGPAASFHFELNRVSDNKSVCPENYFTPEALAELEGLLARSNYPDKEKYPNICNECGEGGCR